MKVLGFFWIHVFSILLYWWALIFGHKMRIKWYYIWRFVCISLMINESEHFFRRWASFNSDGCFPGGVDFPALSRFTHVYPESSHLHWRSPGADRKDTYAWYIQILPTWSQLKPHRTAYLGMAEIRGEAEDIWVGESEVSSISLFFVSFFGPKMRVLKINNRRIYPIIFNDMIGYIHSQVCHVILYYAFWF